MFEGLNFQMRRLRKELVIELGVTILTSCVYCTSLSYLSKDKKDIIKVCIKVCI